MEKFAKKLKELRLERNLNRETLAKEIGVSASIIRYWEDGVKTPKIDAVIALAKFFHISIDELVGLLD